MTTHESTRSSRIAVGTRVLDTTAGCVGVVQLLQDDLGGIRTEAIEDPTRALLRPVGRQGPSWWVHVDDLDRPSGGGQ